MDWFLILAAVLIGVVILAMSVYLVILYQSPDDENQAWFPKVVVVLALCLACVTVLLLPYDVANRPNPLGQQRLAAGGGLDTVKMWMAILWMDAIFVVVIIPFTTFYYEAYDPENSNGFISQVTPAFLYTLGTIFVFGILMLIIWLAVAVAVIPYKGYENSWQCVDVFNETLGVLKYSNTAKDETMEIKPSLFVFVVAALTAVGWLLFFVYGGVGLAALPVDVITAWMNRPKPIGAAEFAREKDVVAAKAQQILKVASELQKKDRKCTQRKSKNRINDLKAEVYLLERKLEDLEIAHNDHGAGPICSMMKAMLGVVCFMLSLLWIFHIFLYYFEVSPFLNTMLIDLDQTFALLGVMAYALFAYYLLWCTIKGCIKIGMRLVFFTIHPMIPNDTLMNSMLFNAGLVLLSSVAVVHFCAHNFRDYARYTAVDGLLNVFVKRLKGIGPAIGYMQFFFVGVVLLSIFWIMMCPRKEKKKKNNDDSDDD